MEVLCWFSCTHNRIEWFLFSVRSFVRLVVTIPRGLFGLFCQCESFEWRKAFAFPSFFPFCLIMLRCNDESMRLPFFSALLKNKHKQMHAHLLNEKLFGLLRVSIYFPSSSPCSHWISCHAIPCYGFHIALVRNGFILVWLVFALPPHLKSFSNSYNNSNNNHNLQQNRKKTRTHSLTHTGKKREPETKNKLHVTMSVNIYKVKSKTYTKRVKRISLLSIHTHILALTLMSLNTSYTRSACNCMCHVYVAGFYTI